MALSLQELSGAYANALEAFNTLSQLPDHNPKEKGGYLVILSMRSGIVEAILLIGECSAENASRYHRFALEKAMRLSEHRDHVSSWQSRNPEKEQYQGGVKFGDYVHAFSGLSEKKDEVIALMSIVGASHIKRRDARQIAEISDNIELLVQCLD